MKLAEDSVWLIPKDSKILVKRLLKAVNLYTIYQEKSDKHLRLLRLLQGRALSGLDTGAGVNQLPNYQAQIEHSKRVESQLSTS